MATRGKRSGLLAADQLDPQVRMVLAPLIDTVQRATGVTLVKVAKLPETATLVDVIRKLNAVIARLQED